MASLKILCTIGLQGTFSHLIPELEAVGKSKIDVRFGVATSLLQAIEGGIEFDAAVLTSAVARGLVGSGKIVPSSVRDIARSGLGLAVRKHAFRPDISSVDGLKAAFRAARSIASSEGGLAGAYFLEVLEQLNITAQIAPKLVLETSGGYAAAITARGEAELAVQLISEIVPVRGVDLVGPFPSEVQRYATLSSCVSAQCERRSDVDAVIDFLRAPASQRTLAAWGLERCE